MYTQSYQGIYRANVVLGNLSVVSAANRDNVEGQALFIRALIHFEMVKLFGQPFGFNADNSQLGVPIRLTATPESKDRSTVKQVYDQIIADLKLAEAKMLDDNNGFANKWAAKGLLAKVYFQMNDFPNAYNYANQVISTGKYILDATYATRSLKVYLQKVFSRSFLAGVF